ncbi:hypothetical protein G3I16_12610 [Streptomyces sp. SID11726]|nr:hypothetical protein [Streptomyces sp. SID11726]NDZ94943.1 hypothetical protein [Streptomyces sp. SID11726]
MKRSKTTQPQPVSQNGDETQPASKSAASKPELREFFVPGRGLVMAADIGDVRKQLSDKQREEGDGNS